MSTQKASASRLFHTLRHLKPRQVTARIVRVITQKLPSYVPSDGGLKLEQRGNFFESPRSIPSQISESDFLFLNVAGEVRRPEDWNSAKHSKLWLYNVHYFDDLNAPRSPDRDIWHKTLLRRWIAENLPGHGNGWESYPLSLRIVNWIKWHLAGNELDEIAQRSLAQQVRFLYRHVEWHLMGNHLFANAKALIFAGLFFCDKEAQNWLKHGLSILQSEIIEQILPDGGHFELSPMYHAIILEDVLDLVNIAKCYEAKWITARGPNLTKTAQVMVRFLRALTHRDGEISFFNDSSFGIAKPTGELCRYASTLGLVVDKSVGGTVLFDASGYVLLEAKNSSVLADVGRVGPDYIPGHAHADTLSMEFSLGPERVIVNCGTSTYERNAQRHEERSTRSHSTVEIDHQNSSDVWAAFRVGRRAYVRNVKLEKIGDGSILVAEHDGYRHLKGRNTHRRRWALDAHRLDIEDNIIGQYSSASARFHLMPGTKLFISGEGTSGTLTLPSNRVISWQTSSSAQAHASCFHRGFGKSEDSVCLSIAFSGGSLKTSFFWSVA
jgi:uncharacterized heparinase superfamily protein